MIVIAFVAAFINMLPWFFWKRAPAKLATWLCLLHRSALKRDILISKHRSGASFSATEVKINSVSFSRWLPSWAFPWQWFRQITDSVSRNRVNPSMRAPAQLARHLATLRSLRLTCVYIYIPTINTSGQLHNRFHIKSCICIYIYMIYIYRDLYTCMYVCIRVSLDCSRKRYSITTTSV